MDHQKWHDAYSKKYKPLNLMRVLECKPLLRI
jgi:hypothetical protein